MRSVNRTIIKKPQKSINSFKIPAQKTEYDKVIILLKDKKNENTIKTFVLE